MPGCARPLAAAREEDMGEDPAVMEIEIASPSPHGDEGEDFIDK